jgi:preprotein translocase subunit SecE
MTSNSKAAEGKPLPPQPSSLDAVKLGVAGLLALIAIAVYHAFPQSSLLLRVLGLFAAAGIGVALILTTALGHQISAFAKGSQMEVRKVVWPTRQETMQTTLAVFAVVLLCSLFLWLLDLGLSSLMRLLTGS